MNTMRCRSLDEFKATQASPSMSATAMAVFEKGIIGAEQTTHLSDGKFTVPGYCLVCSRAVAFLVGYEHCFLAADGQRTPNWREHLRCPSCLLNNRMRAAAGFLLSLSKPSDAIYLTEFVTPLFKAVSRHRRHLAGSEYLRDGTAGGARNAQGIQHQDVSQLTFADDSFDMIGSFEVLEHVPNYTQALLEFHRCLRPDGTLLLTVPFLLWSAATLVRATMDQSGHITHLLPAEIHGDPLSDEGALCFYHFGWDLLDHMQNVGFTETGISMFWEPRYGYLGGHQFVITARKPPISKAGAARFPRLRKLAKRLGWDKGDANHP